MFSRRQKTASNQLFWRRRWLTIGQNESCRLANSPPKHASADAAACLGALHTMVNTAIAYFLDNGDDQQNGGDPNVNWVQYV